MTKIAVRKIHTCQVISVDSIPKSMTFDEILITN